MSGALFIKNVMIFQVCPRFYLPRAAGKSHIFQWWVDW